MKDLSGLWVFITGSATGIGYETALAFADEGANIIATDLDLPSLTLVKTNCEKRHVKVKVFELNVTNPIHFESIIDDLKGNGIEVDILVNNAGIGWFGSIEDHTMDKWRSTFEVNIMGVINGTCAFLSIFKQSSLDKHIVNISSLAAIAPAVNMSAYATSKYEVMGFTDTLGVECTGTNVSVTCVHPGTINTDIVKSHETGESVSKEHLNNLQKFYHDKGSLPVVVAKDIVKAVQTKQVRLFTGASAKPTSILKRFLSSKQMWNISHFLSRKIGFID